MKLTCDICGGTLQMNSDGKGASCVNCGITYSVERLREKLGSQSPIPDATYVSAENPPKQIPEEKIPCDMTDYGENGPAPGSSPMRLLRIMRKRSFILFKAAVFIDGQQCAVLEKPGSVTDIPVSPGLHRISFRVATANGITEMDNSRTFCVADRDWYGVFYMQRNAFGASCKFDMHEI